jgi:hypothetical protein
LKHPPRLPEALLVSFLAPNNESSIAKIFSGAGFLKFAGSGVRYLQSNPLLSGLLPFRYCFCLQSDAEKLKHRTSS